MLMELLVATFGKVLQSISVSYVQSKKQSVESSQPFWLLSLFEFCLRPLFFLLPWFIDSTFSSPKRSNARNIFLIRKLFSTFFGCVKTRILARSLP